MAGAADETFTGALIFFDGSNYTDLTDHTGDPRFTPDIGSLGSISSFGEDARGNLYILDLFGGEVFLLPEAGHMQLQLAGIALLLALWRRTTARGRL